MKKVYLVCLASLLSVSGAFAHGKVVTFGKTAEIIAVYSTGVKLKPFETTVNKNNPYGADAGQTKWLKVVDEAGSMAGVVGVEKVNTPHGYLAQATCFNKTGEKVVKVLLLKAARDEAKELLENTSVKNWWRKMAPPEKANDAWGVLLRSVARTRAALICCAASPGLKPL